MVYLVRILIKSDGNGFMINYFLEIRIILIVLFVVVLDVYYKYKCIKMIKKNNYLLNDYFKK